ncbi:MAG: serine/threonine-protein kinase [Methanofollis sp.]|nr:serine/threonine-protein kinase [Methanofollis sp.]
MRSEKRCTIMRVVVAFLVVLAFVVQVAAVPPDHAANDMGARGHGQDAPPGLAHAPGQQKTVPTPEITTPALTPAPTTEAQTPEPTTAPTPLPPTETPAPESTPATPLPSPTPLPTLPTVEVQETTAAGDPVGETGPVPSLIISAAALLVSAAALGGVVYARRREQGASPPLAVVNEETTVVVPPETTSVPDSGFPPALSEKYTRVVSVGTGGTARVFRAIRRADDQTVAVKVPLRQDEATGRCFLREISIWQGLAHPNIVRVYAVNVLPVPYVETEYLDRSLADLETPLNPTGAIELVRGIAAGLAYAHARGVVHRDLKPGNILLAADATPKIADWGLGKVLGEGDETVAPGYSLHYAAPEQLAPARFGPPDERTDLYQLGVVFSLLLTGTLPYDDDGPGAYSAAVLDTPPTPPSAVDPVLAPFDGIVLRCLAKDPATRFNSAEEFCAALDAVEY